jgi:ApaG protein
MAHAHGRCDVVVAARRGLCRHRSRRAPARLARGGRDAVKTTTTRTTTRTMAVGKPGDDFDASRGALTRAVPTPSTKRIVKQLREELERCVAEEDFARCAEVRDKLLDADPKARHERAMALAIEEERYADAARARDEIRAIEAAEDALERAPSRSSCVTRGIRVDVEAEYQRLRSAPASNAFFHTYTVTITNENNDADAVQLLSRSWLITDGQGRCETVKGAGVIGQQPTLRKGQSFTYASACPLRTPRGTMEGFYRFVEFTVSEHDENELVPRDEFDAEISTFGLDATSDD